MSWRVSAAAERSDVGDYVVFHHFVPPDPRIRPVAAAGWRRAVVALGARRSWLRPPGIVDSGSAPSAVAHGRDRPRLVSPITQVSLLSAPWAADSTPGLRVETSEDGKRWETVSSDPNVLAGAHWWKGHPRLDDSGRVIVRFAPRPARYVRVTDIGAPLPGGQWSVSELFVYETAESPWAPSASAASALTATTGELALDNPRGIPSRTPARRNQSAGPRCSPRRTRLPPPTGGRHPFACLRLGRVWARASGCLPREDGRQKLLPLIEAQPNTRLRGDDAAIARGLGRPTGARFARAGPTRAGQCLHRRGLPVLRGAGRQLLQHHARALVLAIPPSCQRLHRRARRGPEAVDAAAGWA